MGYLGILGALITLTGALFILFAAVGLLRMPDIYNRIQAGTKATTLGSMLTLLGIGLIHPAWLLKIALLIIFVFVSNPVSSHVLGRAAHHIRVPLSSRTVKDQLAESESSSTNEQEVSE
ncbi:MAG: Na+/H+ antiporter subunit G [Bacteroidales bacterium]|nr:Na+/H+ antiporter subunit G [Bacteroidales bacterium]